MALKQPKGSVLKLSFLTLNLTTYNPPVVGNTCVVFGTAVILAVPSPQSHSYLTTLPVGEVELDALKATVDEPGDNEVDGQISTVEELTKAAVGGVQGVTQEIVAVKPAYSKPPSEINRKDKHT